MIQERNNLICKVDGIKLSVFLVAFSFIFYACQSQNPNPSDSPRVKIVYLKGGFTTPVAVSECIQIFGFPTALGDTTITDKKTVNEFISLINDLKKSPKE